MTAQGRATVPEPPQWLRGVASRDGDWITLDPGRAETYHPLEQADLLFDLAAIHRPEDAVAFVGRYGLLRHGPGSDTFREHIKKWEDAALRLRFILRLHRTIQGAIGGDRDSLIELREVWQPGIAANFQAPAASDDELLAQASKAVAWAVSDGLEGVQQRVSAAVEWGNGPAGAYLFSVSPPNLLGYAYHQLALALVSRVPMAPCADCGRFFVVDDPRKRYCSSTCSARTRQRRLAKKAREGRSDV